MPKMKVGEGEFRCLEDLVHKTLEKVRWVKKYVIFCDVILSPSYKNTVKLRYNEQLGTGHFVHYNRVNLCTKKNST